MTKALILTLKDWWEAEERPAIAHRLRIPTARFTHLLRHAWSHRHTQTVRFGRAGSGQLQRVGWARLN